MIIHSSSNLILSLEQDAQEPGEISCVLREIITIVAPCSHMPVWIGSIPGPLGFQFTRGPWIGKWGRGRMGVISVFSSISSKYRRDFFLFIRCSAL
jgi:hypothetical protein